MKKVLSLMFVTGFTFAACSQTPVAELEQPKEIEEVGIQNITPEVSLTTFFDHLNNKEFDKALHFFEPEDWDAVRVYSPVEDYNDKVKVLEQYCNATGTCLRAKVLEVQEITEEEYTLRTQFLNADGSIYIFGPCCGASEEEMPSQDEFDFTVKRVDGVFKVTTPPLYRP